MLTDFKLLLNTIQKGQVPIIDGSLQLHDEVKQVRYELCYDLGYLNFKDQAGLES